MNTHCPTCGTKQRKKKPPKHVWVSGNKYEVSRVDEYETIYVKTELGERKIRPQYLGGMFMGLCFHDKKEI